MSCVSCRSANETELAAEMIIHSPRLNLKNPGVWVFPKLVVCLDCGFSQFSVSESELASIASGAGENVQ